MKKFLKQTGAVILAFATLVCLLEMIYRLLKVPKITHHNIYAKGQELVPKISSGTVLIIGDSKLEWGVKPYSVAASLNNSSLNVVNMATPGSNGLDLMKYLLQHKIYPKLIIHGYASNYGNYGNHGFDKEEYSVRNRLTEKLLYFMDQHFYFRDRSVLEYIQHGRPYFKSHVYDSLGGATVTEYGDYAKRSGTQIEMYKGFKKNFRQTAFDRYAYEADSLVKLFRQNGTIVCCVAMPATDRISELQNDGVKPVISNISYNRFYDLSRFTYGVQPAKADSSFFYDGCHLSPEYAPAFTGMLMERILKDFPSVNKN